MCNCDVQQVGNDEGQTVHMQKGCSRQGFPESFCMLHAEAFATRQRVRFPATSVCHRTAEFSIFRTFSYVSCVCVASPQRKCRFDLVGRNNEVANKGPELCVACATADQPASRPSVPACFGAKGSGSHVNVCLRPCSIACPWATRVTQRQ